MSGITANLQMNGTKRFKYCRGLRITLCESLGKWSIVELGSVEVRLNHRMGYAGILTSRQPSDRWQRWSPQRLNERKRTANTHIKISNYFNISNYTHTLLGYCLDQCFFLRIKYQRPMCPLHRFIPMKNKVILPPSHAQLTEKDCV